MNRSRPSPALQILQRASDVLQPSLIEEIKVPVGQTGMNQRGSRVDDEPKVRGVPGLFGTMSAGSHVAHYILFSLFRISRQISSCAKASFDFPVAREGVNICAYGDILTLTCTFTMSHC